MAESKAASAAQNRFKQAQAPQGGSAVPEVVAKSGVATSVEAT